jgi:hypothetical protein
MLTRTALLGFLTEGLPVRRPNVDPGHAYMSSRDNDPSALLKLRQQVGWHPKHVEKGTTRMSAIETRIASGNVSPAEKKGLRSIRRRIRRKVQKHAKRITKALAFDKTPEMRNAPYQPTNPRDRARFHEFPNTSPRSGKRAERANLKHRAYMQRVLHFLRRSGTALGGQHNADASHKHGVFSMHFGRDESHSGAFMQHVAKRLPKTIANSIRYERGGHSGASTHRLEVGHNDLWNAVGRHLAGIEEMTRTPLLALLTASAGSIDSRPTT